MAKRRPIVKEDGHLRMITTPGAFRWWRCLVSTPSTSPTWSANFARLKNAFLVLTVLWVSTHDAVLAADISPDHGQVALGGPSKVVRVW